MADELADALEGEVVLELVFVDQADRHPVGGVVKSRRFAALGRHLVVDGLAERLFESGEERLARELEDRLCLRQHRPLAGAGGTHQRFQGIGGRVDGVGDRRANGLLRRLERRLHV